MSIIFRKPVVEDVTAIARVAFNAFSGIATAHNFPLDFPSVDHALGLADAFTKHPQFFGVLAEEKGRVIGCNFLSRRNSVAAIGPICVEPSQQGRGIGRKLMAAAMEAGKSHRSVRLVQDAFNTTSMSLYAALGFETREPLALMRGRCASAKKWEALRPMTEKDLPACSALCERVHGFLRDGELRDAVKMLRPHVLERGGKIVAYASSPWMWFLNHGVAETEADMRELLLALSAASVEPMMLLVPTRAASLFRFLLSEKLQVVKPMTLMTTGSYQEPTAAWYPSVEY